MTKIFYGLPIWLVQTGPVNIEVVINVEFSGNSKVVIDSASFKQLMAIAMTMFKTIDFRAIMALVNWERPARRI